MMWECHNEMLCSTNSGTKQNKAPHYGVARPPQIAYTHQRYLFRNQEYSRKNAFSVALRHCCMTTLETH